MEEIGQLTRRHFHVVLRHYRHASGLTQEQLAEKIGISVGFLGMMEVGRRWPNIDMLFRIAKALNIRPGELIDALERETQKK